MSVAFSSARPRTKGEVTQQTIQKMLDENHHLIQCIMDYQSKGKTAECTQYQQILHRNLVYLATIADSNQNMQSLLPAPPTNNMGPGGHPSGNINDNMTSGLPPTSMMQSQLSNGHGEYSYQQSSYGDQGYERSFDESSQHYYDGGNSQYSQQQAQYQQGSGQQPFGQQQYSSQQGYSGPPQGYGAGGSSQYSQYQQGQSQQYGSYRSSQGGPGAQTQRPYSYEQGQYGNYQQ